MRILLTCDPEIAVPPANYGGIERIVDGLAKGYTDEGHSVYLIANAQSTCKHTKGNFGWPAPHSRGFINNLLNTVFLKKISDKIKPDVVHSFSRLLYGYSLFLSSGIPFLQSYQRRISAGSTSFALRLAGNKLHFTSCAAHMLKGLPNQKAFSPVFNFTNVDYFSYDASIERTHLMFLGRIEAIKGTKEAIQAALQSHSKIVVAGNVQPGHDHYFEQEITPLLSHPLVQYVGTVNDEEKKYYLQRSKALLFPVKWEEPFGIVLAEALACGTPVIGFNRGSVPEVIKEGKNGYLVNTLNEMIEAISRIHQLENSIVRAHAVERFSLSHITKLYVTLFAKMKNKVHN